jgi:hypothetical protein
MRDFHRDAILTNLLTRDFFVRIVAMPIALLVSILGGNPDARLYLRLLYIFVPSSHFPGDASNSIVAI